MRQLVEMNIGDMGGLSRVHLRNGVPHVVSALGYDPLSPATAASLGLPVILMHAQGNPKTMQLNPTYEDVRLDVFDALAMRNV